jgi:hypothetical protein
MGAYGRLGFTLANDGTSLPGADSVGVSGQANFTWAGSTNDARALQKAAGTADRLAATWYASTGFTIDVNLADGQAHKVSLYLLDWDNGNRSERIDVIDPATGNVLDSRTVTAFQGGQYLSWTVSGHVQFRITNLASANSNAVVSGVFLD